MPPRAPLAGSVTAITWAKSAFSAWVMNRLTPLIDVAVGPAHRARAHRRRIGAGIRLGLREAGRLLAGKHRIEITPLLLAL